MNNIFKICLTLGLFFSFVSVSWASFNYDSVNNFFLIDSVLRTEGDYFLVGESLSGYCVDDAINKQPLPEYLTISQCESAGWVWLEELKRDAGADSDQFFSISNNLIFLSNNSVFKGGNRVIRRGSFATNTITVQNPINNFQILSSGGPLSITFKYPDSANTVSMNQDFIINNGFSIMQDQDIANTLMSDNTILAEKVLANEIKLLSLDNLSLFDNRVLTVTGAPSEIIGTFSEIKLGDEGSIDDDFCRRIDFPETRINSDANANESKAMSDTNLNISCGEGKEGEQGSPDTAQLTCCPYGYYVFDIDLDDGKMVCCRFSRANPLP